MKNLSIVLNGVLLVAVGILYVLYFTHHNGKGTPEQAEVKDKGTDVPRIVYINTDTLFSNYQYAVELSEEFMNKEEERRTQLNIRAKELDRETKEFQNKVENGGFISEQRALEVRDKLVAKQRDLQKLQQEMMDKAMLEQNELHRKLFEAVTGFLKAYSKEHSFDIVLSTTLGGNVFYSQQGFDITHEVVKGLNASYVKK